MDQTMKDALAFLVAMTGQTPMHLEAKGSGFHFIFEGLDRSSMELFGEKMDYSNGPDYCLLSTQQEDDYGQFQETMRYNLDPADAGDRQSFHAEVYYTRPLRGTRAENNATVDGILWLTNLKSHEAMGKECDDSHHERTVEHVVCELRDAANLVASMRWSGSRANPELQASTRQKLIDAVSDINRKLIRGHD